MEYNFRTLTSKDIFPMFKILNKIGVGELKKCMQSAEIKDAILGMQDKSDESLSAVGMSIMLEIANVVIANIPKCEEDIYNLLVSVSDLSRKDLEKMAMAEFLQMIVDFIKKDEFKDFFTVVLKLFK